MSFSLALNDSHSDDAEGRILAGDLNERFHTNLSVWQKEEYRQQWVVAARRCTHFLREACLFTSVDLDERGLGQLWTIELHPCAALEPRDGVPADGHEVLVTSRFHFVSSTVEGLRQPWVLEDSDDPAEAEFAALKYLDLRKPWAFFAYIEPPRPSVSIWRTTRDDIRRWAETA